MKFSIITPTYRRSEKLTRAVNSLLAQTYKNWEMIIINDSPKDEEYRSFEQSINDQRIHYHKHTINQGVNAARNTGLEKISADSKWVIFLDDDDFFAPDTLQTLAGLITHTDSKWFITNRALKSGKPLTQFTESSKTYNYTWSYLLTKQVKGDATHCIETQLIHLHKLRFSHYVKQGEEWFFFYQLAQYANPFYYDHNSTITDGYDENGGLNFRKRNLREYYETLTKLYYELANKHLLKPAILLYLLLRLIRPLFTVFKHRK